MARSTSATRWRAASELRLAARHVFARGAHRLERGAGGAVGFGETRFGAGARVGRVAARGLGLFERIHQRAALADESVGRVAEARLFLLRRRQPLFELADAVLRAIAALRP